EDVAAGFTCGMGGGGQKESFYLSQFSPASGPKRVGLWMTKAARAQCVPDGTSEATPRFGFAVGGTIHTVDLTSSNAIATSLDAAYGEMSTAIQSAIANTVKWESRFETQRCANNPFRDGNCKLS